MEAQVEPCVESYPLAEISPTQNSPFRYADHIYSFSGPMLTADAGKIERIDFQPFG